VRDAITRHSPVTTTTTQTTKEAITTTPDGTPPLLQPPYEVSAFVCQASPGTSRDMPS
jgi:hypothetical protein